MSQSNRDPIAPTTTEHTVLAKNDDPPLQVKTNVDPTMTTNTMASLFHDSDLDPVEDVVGKPIVSTEQTTQQVATTPVQPDGGQGAASAATTSPTVAKPSDATLKASSSTAAQQTKAPAQQSTQQTQPADAGDNSLAKSVLSALRGASGQQAQTQQTQQTQTTQQTQQQQQQQPPIQDGQRDYTGIDPQDRDYFSRMSNEAFARMRPMYLEHRDLAQRVKLAEDKLKAQEESVYTAEKLKTWTDHPDSFLLTPEYKEADTTFKLVDDIDRHWREQYKRVRKGEDWIPLIQNEKGEFVTGESRPASVDDELLIQGQLQRVSETKNSLLTRISKLESEFKASHTNTVQFIRNGLERKFFSQFEPENISKPEMARYKQLYDEVYSTFPPALKQNIAGPLVAKLMTAFIDLGQIMERQQKAPAQTLQQRDAQIVQPTSGQGRVANTVVPVTNATVTTVTQQQQQASNTDDLALIKSLVDDPDLR